MSWYVIINPNAGMNQIDTTLSKLKTILDQEAISYQYVLTDAKLHAKELCESAIHKGYRKIMAVGGDGTNHEVINGIMSQNIVPSTDILFFNLPNGTGNDWGKHYNLPIKWEERIKLLQQPNIKLQDIGIANFYIDGVANSRFFNSVAGLAYDAFVVKSLEEKGRKGSSISYLISVFKLLFKYKPNNVELQFNNKTIQTPVYTINLGICKYTGGGMSLTPHAISDDGLLALTIAKNLSKLNVLWNTYRFYNESLLSHPKIDGHQTKQISIKSTDKNAILLELDGEYVGHGPVEISIMERKLKFVGA